MAGAGAAVLSVIFDATHVLSLVLTHSALASGNERFDVLTPIGTNF
jgi:hypothetical protein